MSLLINLHPDTCQMYRDWRIYLKHDSPSAYQLATAAVFNATARNLMNRAIRKGYVATTISWSERTKYLDDIHEINTSRPKRQGRPMASHYLEYPKPYSDDQRCIIHYSKFHVIFSSESRLVAYIGGNHCGELSAASQILGHSDHLKHGIMYLLWDHFIRWSAYHHAPHIIYSRWSDGTDGLRIWKHAVGLSEQQLKESIMPDKSV